MLLESERQPWVPSALIWKTTRQFEFARGVSLLDYIAEPWELLAFFQWNRVSARNSEKGASAGMRGADGTTECWIEGMWAHLAVVMYGSETLHWWKVFHFVVELWFSSRVASVHFFVFINKFPKTFTKTCHIQMLLLSNSFTFSEKQIKGSKEDSRDYPSWPLKHWSLAYTWSILSMVVRFLIRT